MTLKVVLGGLDDWSLTVKTSYSLEYGRVTEVILSLAEHFSWKDKDNLVFTATLRFSNNVRYLTYYFCMWAVPHKQR